MTAELQDRVQAAIDGLVRDGAEVGLQVAVLHRGELIAEVMNVPSAWAFGFGPHRPPGGTPSRPESVFGMLGANGSAAYADIDSGVAVVVLRNLFSVDWTAAATVDRLVADAFSG